MINREKDPIGWLVEEVKWRGLGDIFGEWLGIYRGKVIDVEDPEGLGRVRVLVPILGLIQEGDIPKELWAEVLIQGSVKESVISDKGKQGNGDIGRQVRGYNHRYESGDLVLIMFLDGDVRKPIVVGGWVPKDKGDSQGNNKRYNIEGKADFINRGEVIRDKQGGYVRLYEGNIDIKGGVNGDSIDVGISINSIDKDKGSIELNVTKDIKVTIDNNKVEVDFGGNLIKVTSSNIELKKGSSSIVIGDSGIKIKGGTIDIEGQSINLSGDLVKIGRGGAYESAVLGDSLSLSIQTHSHIVPPPNPPPAPTASGPYVGSAITKGNQLSTKVLIAR